MELCLMKSAGKQALNDSRADPHKTRMTELTIVAKREVDRRSRRQSSLQTKYVLSRKIRLEKGNKRVSIRPGLMSTSRQQPYGAQETRENACVGVARAHGAENDGRRHYYMNGTKLAGRRPLNISQATRPRGQVFVIPNRCKGCNFCIEFCPADVLEASREINAKGYHFPVVREDRIGSCIHCQFCDLVCPELAIYTQLVP
jgi:2-oxoglutarate ferredoxin oxidoreductase subunit delta